MVNEIRIFQDFGSDPRKIEAYASFFHFNYRNGFDFYYHRVCRKGIFIFVVRVVSHIASLAFTEGAIQINVDA